MQPLLIFLLTFGIFFLTNADDAIIDTNIWPLPDDHPNLCNGHVGFVIYGNSILMNGLYNGARGQSHRARIPNYANVLTETECNQNNCAYQLNMRQGFFQNVKSFGTNYKVTQHLYAHRFYNRAIINRVVAERQQQVGNFSISLVVNPGEISSVDLTETHSNSTSILTRPVTIRCYQTNVVEDPFYQSEPSRVCVAHTDPPSSLAVDANANIAEYYHITTIARSEQEVVKELIDILTALDQAIDIFEIHTSVWENDWNRFEISVQGNAALNKVIHSSIFYLVSNLPSINTNQQKDFFWGLSPGGIPKGGVLYEAYQGHSFWDTEMWMHPPLLLMNPQWSRDILHYRYMVRTAAKDNAANTTYKGYRYPWESAYTGREVTPDCCPEVVNFQHHIISDIAFAYKSHLAATHDLEWWKTFGCDIAWNTAKFWESRVTYNSATKKYDINGIMGPDEDNFNITNNVYTNVNAAYNLLFGDFAGCSCKDILKVSDEEYENFENIANNLKILYDNTRDLHPQFEGYAGQEIKQADVVLLGFPLQYPMKPSTKRNNLIYYANLTRENGPAMTWAMHTIGFLDLNDEAEAAKNFDRSYSVYVREPFLVWSETMPGLPAAGNFITGAGGFLQSIINGYGGIRLHFNHMSITNFYVPPKSQSLEFKGITYLNNRFNLTITAQDATLTFIELDENHKLSVTKRPSNEKYTPQKDVSIKFEHDEELILEAATYPFGECLMKEVSSSGTIKLSIALIALISIVKLFV